MAKGTDEVAHELSVIKSDMTTNSVLFSVSLTCRDHLCPHSGAVWAEHLVNWKRYQMHIATVSILLLTTGLFAFLGILPLLDNFFHLGALVAGALMCCILVIPPWVSHDIGQNGPDLHGESRNFASAVANQSQTYFLLIQSKFMVGCKCVEYLIHLPLL